MFLWSWLVTAFTDPTHGKGVALVTLFSIGLPLLVLSPRLVDWVYVWLERKKGK